MIKGRSWSNVMLGASVSWYTRPWIKLLVSRTNTDTTTSIKLVDSIRRRLSIRYPLLHTGFSVHLEKLIGYIVCGPHNYALICQKMKKLIFKMSIFLFIFDKYFQRISLHNLYLSHDIIIHWPLFLPLEYKMKAELKRVLRYFNNIDNDLIDNTMRNLVM